MTAAGGRGARTGLLEERVGPRGRLKESRNEVGGENRRKEADEG